MRLVLFTIPAAVPIGFATGVRLVRLAGLSLHWLLLGLAGVVLQLAPASGTVGLILLLGSFGLLLVAVWVNRRMSGFVLLLAYAGASWCVIRGMHRRPTVGSSDQPRDLRIAEASH